MPPGTALPSNERHRVVSRDFDGIRIDITYKDLELQTTLAKSLNVPLFLGTICQQIYQIGRAAGLGSEDGAAIVKIYEQMTCVAVASTCLPREQEWAELLPI